MRREKHLESYPVKLIAALERLEAREARRRYVTPLRGWLKLLTDLATVGVSCRFVSRHSGHKRTIFMPARVYSTV